MGHIDRNTLKQLASRYIWWKTTDEVLNMPEWVIAQVMVIGDYAEVQQLAHLVGGDVLREVIKDGILLRPLGQPKLTLAQKLKALDPNVPSAEAMADGRVGREDF